MVISGTNGISNKQVQVLFHLSDILYSIINKTTDFAYEFSIQILGVS